MGKTKRRVNRKDNEETEAQREERLLNQLASHGRLPTPPPGHFHTPKKRAANRRKERHDERVDLKHLIEEYNRE